MVGSKKYSIHLLDSPNFTIFFYQVFLTTRSSSYDNYEEGFRKMRPPPIMNKIMVEILGPHFKSEAKTIEVSIKTNSTRQHEAISNDRCLPLEQKKKV